MLFIFWQKGVLRIKSIVYEYKVVMFWEGFNLDFFKNYNLFWIMYQLVDVQYVIDKIVLIIYFLVIFIVYIVWLMGRVNCYFFIFVRVILKVFV